MKQLDTSKSRRQPLASISRSTLGWVTGTPEFIGLLPQPNRLS